LIGQPGGEKGARPSDDENLIDLVAQLRSVIARQQQTIVRQQSELAALRDGTGPARAAVPRPAPAAVGNGTGAPVAGADFTLVFDGGSIGNPGRGYGSYQIVGADGVLAHERLEYGDRVTNNQAEYRTLIEGLKDLRDRTGRAARERTVAVRGDSQLVIQQVNGRWKVKHPELQPLHAEVLELLRGFRRSDVAWHRRDASVRVLGH
jgi:probable phosphoglycerate mutase